MSFVFGNLAVLVAIAMAWIGMFAGILISQPRKDQVAKLQSADVRGALFDVAQETEFVMYTKGFWTYPPQKFIKWAQPILLTNRNFLGQLVKRNLWLAREGVACTETLQDGDIEKVPLAKYIETVFGEKNYRVIPSDVRKEIESGKVNITVKLGKSEMPSSLAKVTENNIAEENDRRFFSNLGQVIGKSIGQNLWLMGGMMGFGGLITTMIFLFTGHLT